ncbi:hypothetical protein [Pseudomonas granadensis]|uniref:hypothetical protein n=1 Tax=Pseudomonas granadensis TaxID=1421430 RepID=UPI0012FD58C2|nr:hypothetical protein [Pseudomonas granadensis]
MKIDQLITNFGASMSRVRKRPSVAMIRSVKNRKSVEPELTASQKRLLQLLATGIEDEPSVLAAGRL